MSDDVSNFLKQVRELGDRRMEEDQARSRELEEKILQEKRERQARRAERARSISPQKSSPTSSPRLGSPAPSGHRASQLLNNPPTLSSPLLYSRPHAGAPDTITTTANTSGSAPVSVPASASDTDMRLGESNAPLGADYDSRQTTGSSMTTTLPWQKRPARANSRGRPLSMFAAENAAALNGDKRPSVSEEPLSRDQISEILMSKEATRPRGYSAAAQQRRALFDAGHGLELDMVHSGLSPRLQEPPSEPSKELEESLPSKDADSLSPLALTPNHRLEHPTITGSSSFIPSSGHSSPIRASSPTKGAGGFVQSAMMKRSDSVNKRWTVQSPQLPMLGRTGSTLSNRYSRDLGHIMAQKPHLSRPASSADYHNDNDAMSETVEETSNTTTNTSAIPTTTTNITTSTSTSTYTTSGAAAADLDPLPHKLSKHGSHKSMSSLPSSPSKTADVRRWSPSKSSWLDSALKRPESPKSTVNLSQQPSWMVELSKSRSQKSDSPVSEPVKPLSTAQPKPEVTTSGLMRAPPPGTNVKPPATISGLEGIASPKATSIQTNVGSLRHNLKKSGSLSSVTNSPTTTTYGRTTPTPTPDSSQKLDFRANLRPRAVNEVSNKGERDQHQDPVHELKNVVGSLRRTTANKHVVKDELKDNILRGKAALHATGGPQKTERKDELKEAILKKREEFQKARLQGKSVAVSSGLGGLTPRSSDPFLGRASSMASENRQERAPLSEGVGDRGRGESVSALAKTGPPPAFHPTLHLHHKSTGDFTSKLPMSPVTRAQNSVNPQQQQQQEQAQSSSSVLTSLKNQPISGSSGVGSLAARFNPALAGLLSRGPPGSNPVDPKASSYAASSMAETPLKPGPQLTHMTKNRARGPPRKAPSTSAM